MENRNSISKEIHDALDQSARALMGADACLDPNCGSDQCSAFQAICEILPEIKAKYPLGPSHDKKFRGDIASFRTALSKMEFKDNLEKAIAWVVSRKEEILLAFMAKYGTEPEMVEIKSSYGNEAIWFVRKMSYEPTDIKVGDVIEWMDGRGDSWALSAEDAKNAASHIYHGTEPKSSQKERV